MSMYYFYEISLKDLRLFLKKGRKTAQVMFTVGENTENTDKLKEENENHK